MLRLLSVGLGFLPIFAIAEAATPVSRPMSAPTTDPTPEASTRPNTERRSRAAEALKVLGEVDLKDEANLQRVVTVVEQSVLGDPRLMPCDLHVRLSEPTVVLEGYCLLAEQKAVVIADLQRVGVKDIEDHVAVGPLAGDRPFAIVENEATHVMAHPGRSEQLTVWPVGSLVFLLRQEGDSFLALGPDGYAGFVRAAHLRRVSADELRTRGTNSRVAASSFAFSANHSTTQASSRLHESEETKPPTTSSQRENEGTKPPAALNDPRKTETTQPPTPETEGTKPGAVRNDTRKIDGTEPPTSHTETGETEPPTSHAETGGTEPPRPSHAAQLESAISCASQLLGTPYVWGGIDSTGIDCSGLTRCAFESIGVSLPRDADQQALVGRLIATRWYRDDLRRGDLLFFAGKRGTVSHVAIYLGNGAFLEAADGKVQFSSFDPHSPNYRAKRVDSFCFGKRILE